MEICFIPDNDYAGFIEQAVERVPGAGNFIDKDGRILGRHKGITHYTVGQRKGLNLSMGHPVFVTEIRPDTDEVVIGDGEDVFSDHLICSDVNWMAVEGLNGGERRVMAKIRYSHKGAPCLIRELPDTVKLKETEAEAYAAVWDIMITLEKELPMAYVFYGQDTLVEHNKRYDEIGIFLPNSHFLKHLEKHIEKAEAIIYAQK